MAFVTRFAPSPTGPLHLGHAYSAILAHDIARANGGTFLLRIEDIDRQRCKAVYEQTCLVDLKWLGLDWDEGPETEGRLGPYRQSLRFDAYDQILRRLLESGSVYRCTCSRADISRHVRAPHATGRTEHPYPGTCRKLNISVDSNSNSGGFRLALDRVEGSAIQQWHDAYLGDCTEDVSASCGDFLLGRFGQPTYQLAAVVDDIHMKITDVVRGADLASSSARQRILHQALGAPPPSFAHHPLLLDESGRKLSKRERSVTLEGLRRDGMKPSRLIARILESVGLNPSGHAHLTAENCIEIIATNPSWNDGIWREPVARADSRSSDVFNG